MRMRVNRLIYSLIAVAFVAGLFVTAFARPEPALTSADTCYGRCQSAVTLSLSQTTATLGRENVVVLKFKVTAATPGAGTPTGFVIVTWGHVIVCRATITNGSGQCSPAASVLPLGTHTIVANYNGNGTFDPSSSNGKTLTIIWP